MNKISDLINLKGQYKYDSKKKKYIFDVMKGKKISCESLRYLIDPTYDSTFKILFGAKGAEERLTALLNSLLFPGDDEEKIEELNYLPNEFHSLNKKWNKNALRTDIACEIIINDKKYVLILEMQIGDNGSLTQRLFDYGTSLRNNNSSENCFSLGISISSKVNSNYVKLKKTTAKSSTTLEYINTVLINLDKELINMKNNKNININNKVLDIEGKEFIKLLGIRAWAKKEGEKFIFPNFDLSENEAINECINILSSFNDRQLTEVLMDERYKLDIMKDSEKRGQYRGYIDSAFQIFLEGIPGDDRAYNLLKDNNIILEDEGELIEILKDKPQSLVNQFIVYLNNYEFFNPN